MTDTPARPLRVMIVARLSMVRTALRRLLAGREDILLAGERASVDTADDPGTGPPPDVVLAGWDPGNPDDLASLAGQAAAATPLVLIGDMPAPRELQAALRAGVRGFLLADTAAEDLSTALHSAYHGLLVLDPLLARTLATAAQPGAVEAETAGETLTDREKEILELMALGLPNKTIAHRLSISEHTVKFHVGSVMAKLGATSRTEAVTRAVRQGLLAL